MAFENALEAMIANVAATTYRDPGGSRGGGRTREASAEAAWRDDTPAASSGYSTARFMSGEA